MAWNQPGGNNNNPWGKKPAAGGGDLDQAFKEWQKRVESLFGGGGRSGGFLAALLVIAVAVWMATGFYTVNVGSQGVVQRFGKYVTTVPNGWGWRFPWPIEKVTEVDTAGTKNSNYKSRVLTSEPNMVEVDITVQCRIKDPVDYLFNVKDPQDTLAQISESVFREVVGRNDQQAILTGKRVEIARDTGVLMRSTLDAYGAGIEILNVNIENAQVPEAVQQATGDASRFNQLVTAYEKAPAVTRERLYIETVETVLGRSRKVIIDARDGSGNMIYLPLDKLLERRNETSTGIPVRPPATLDSDPSAAPDGRTRPER